MTTPTPFDDYEIHPVTAYFSSDGTRFCEVADDPAEASFWSLYGHFPGQGVECIGDFPSFEEAAAIYARITGHGWDEEPPVRSTAGLVEALKLALHALNETPGFAFEAATPEQALQMGRDLWVGKSERLDFQDYDMAMPVNEIAVYDLDGSDLAIWHDADMRLRLAAPQLLKALEDLLLWWTHAPRGDEMPGALFAAALAAIAEAKDEALLLESAARERPPSLRDLLKLALHALNEAPCFPVRHPRYRNSYEICAAIEAALRTMDSGAG